MRGDDLASFPIDENTPDDVRLLHRVLSSQTGDLQTFNLGNCGTAMRFLTAWFAQREGCSVVLEGSSRMHERPIGQLVDALREAGADIEYLAKDGFPPLKINGSSLRRQPLKLVNPQSTQFVSALMLTGFKVETDRRSPYIDMTIGMLSDISGYDYPNKPIERDWSAAAFWYEYVALHGGSMLRQGLSTDSIQGDKAVADIFRGLGLETQQEEQGVIISRSCVREDNMSLDFSAFPDLYPAVYATCRCLGVKMQFSGLDSLPLKESDRLKAMRQIDGERQPVYHSFGDHRIAMALLCAGYTVDDMQCIDKSYPQFVKQWQALHL